MGGGEVVAQPAAQHGPETPLHTRPYHVGTPKEDSDVTCKFDEYEGSVHFIPENGL
jgi:hypothetical protein